ncbi:hypothetical protein P154DRAFT_571004 [Amniculicola lignicola CBS 123094]|uniref:BTB domain-containing protein n=1 Tax=Amniculicola lignicola CBS 123094 TaxID=1392246 RepID=A0A6A5WY70_9PLEO|nr:hypothetical protein P154DRAFT_571004 [Amniculicola lignicola CBS 123094]
MATQTITVKLRNPDTSQTQFFTLPRARVLLTSSYFRDHINNLSPPKHTEGMIKLNFPDFAIFAIYVKWLHSGEIFTKASIKSLHPSYALSPSTTAYASPSYSSSTERRPDRKARDTYTDYVGAYFLGDWLRDTVFKDSIISLIIDKMNDLSGEGYPEQFVHALRPSLVDLLWMASALREQKGIRAVVYAGIARFGKREDVRKFLGGERGEEYPREFVQGLTVWLFEAQRVKYDKGEGGDYESTVTCNGGSRTDTSEIPPPFASPARERWCNGSHVTWPSIDEESIDTTWTQSTSAASTANGASVFTHTSTTTSMTSNTATPSISVPREVPADAESEYVPWPRKPEEHCFFHEHLYRGEACYRSRTVWDVYA